MVPRVTKAVPAHCCTFCRPGELTFCFARQTSPEKDSPALPRRGAPETSVMVTKFSAPGPQGDQPGQPPHSTS